jgi:hypothetical protein
MTTSLVVCGILSLISFGVGALMVADNENHYAAICFASGLWVMWIGLMLK